MNDLENYENENMCFIQDAFEDDLPSDFQDDYQFNYQDDIIDYNQNIIHGIPFYNLNEGEDERNHNYNISTSEKNDSNNLMNHDLNHNNIKNKTRKKPKPYHKRKSTLSYQAQCFRELYFSIFTKKKKFPKTIIWDIHKIIQKPLHLSKITREITRDNDKYFERFSNELAIIIQYLRNNKDYIISLIPQLKEYE